MTLKDFLKGKKICIIGAHPDDIELGLGATLSQIKYEDIRVDIFSGANEIEGNENIPQELRASMEVFGIWNWVVHMFDVRKFYEKVDLIRNDVYGLYKNYDVFFTHSKLSHHLDYKMLGDAVYDICKEKTIICFEEIYSGKDIPINTWNEVSVEDMAVKSRALDCYKTQAKRPYFEGGHIIDMARFRGNQILKNYDEAFNIMRLVT